MRIIARGTLVSFWAKHPETRVPLQRWFEVARHAGWRSTHEVQQAFPKAKVLNGEWARFEVSGGDYRMIVAFDFVRQIAFVKFVGTHAEYDRVDALTVSSFLSRCAVAAALETTGLFGARVRSGPPTSRTL